LLSQPQAASSRSTIGFPHALYTPYSICTLAEVSVAIVNYGMANLRSVQKAFERIGVFASIVTDPEDIAGSDRLVLPGVGAVGDAIAHIRSRHLDEPILEHIRRGRPFLGICLGLQMLMSRCLEGGEHAGLDVVPGDCVRFDIDRSMNLKVPHMGWNQLTSTKPSRLLANLPGENVYFVHSYHVRPTDRSWVAATTDYGSPFVSVIERDNVMAVQFHPEKSQRVGLRLIENFVQR
jgi:imidazole glycerol-phosphate synthase subunit HisH